MPRWNVVSRAYSIIRRQGWEAETVLCLIWMSEFIVQGTADEVRVLLPYVIAAQNILLMLCFWMRYFVWAEHDSSHSNLDYNFWPLYYLCFVFFFKSMIHFYQGVIFLLYKYYTHSLECLDPNDCHLRYIRWTFSSHRSHDSSQKSICFTSILDKF